MSGFEIAKCFAQRQNLPGMAVAELYAGRQGVSLGSQRGILARNARYYAPNSRSSLGSS